MNRPNSSLLLLSLNIETDKHLDRFVPFIKDKNIEVVLLQEVLLKDMHTLEKKLNMQGIFTPLSYLLREQGVEMLGLAMFTRLPVIKHLYRYYYGNPNPLPSMLMTDPEKMARAIAVTEIQKNDKSYCVVNTHFTWSPDGQPNDRQHRDVQVMLGFLAEIPEFILCGDFNAPRGRAIFDIIAAKYKDNVPSEITTTIDKNLHYAGALNLVIDGMFTTPQYTVEAIQIVKGLSDHCGLLAEITKALIH